MNMMFCTRKYAIFLSELCMLLNRKNIACRML